MMNMLGGTFGDGYLGQLLLLNTRANEGTQPADVNSLIATSSDMQSNNGSGWGPYDGADMLKVTPSVNCKIWGCTYGSGNTNSYTLSNIYLGVLNGNGSSILKQKTFSQYQFNGNASGANTVEWFLFTEPYETLANTTIQVGTAFASDLSGSQRNSFSYSGGPSSAVTNTTYSGASFTFDNPAYNGAPIPFDNSNGTVLGSGQCQFILVEV